MQQKLWFTLLMIMVWINAYGDGGTKIVVASDIHVMAPSLLPDAAKSQTAWQNYYASQRKMLENSAAYFKEFVTSTVPADTKLLLISGDLTKDGEQVSHNYVKDQLAELKSRIPGIKIYVIPGNHDFGDEGNCTQFNEDGATSAVATMTASTFATFYADYGYGDGSTADPNGSLSYVAEPIEGMVLLAIDSHTGSVSAETLTWICNQATTAKAAGKQVIAMMHHPLFPHITGANLFISTYAVKDYENVRDKLIDAGVKVILTGHFHTSDIAQDWKGTSKTGESIYDINTGSLISYPCDYRTLTLSDDMRTLNVATNSFDNSDESKTWLKNRMTAIIKAKLTYSEPVNTMLASYAADAFILHAEGNENESTSSTKTTLLSLIDSNTSYSSTYGATFHSMMDDKSNYGTEKEDQTNDRNQNIYLTKLILQSNLTNADVTFYKSATKPTAASIEALTDADIVDEADAGEYVVMHIEPYYGGATGYYWTDEALLYGTDAGASLAPRRAEAQRRAPSIDLPLEVKLLKRDTYTEEDDEDNLQTYTKYNGAGWYYYQIPAEHSVANGYKFSLIDGFVPKRFALNSWDDDIVFQNENVVTITDGTDGGWSAEVTVDELNFKFDGEEHAPNITKIIIKKGTDTYIELTDAARIENLLKPYKTKEIGPNTIFAAANNYCWFRGYCWDAEFNITMPFDGSGTEDDPWKIETADDLNMFAKCVNVGKYNFWAKYLMQTKDIDMSGINDFRSIGYMDERSFMGSFDGNNKTISNLKVNMTVMYSEEMDVEFSDFRPVCVGLFGGVGKGIVRNVTLRNSSINYQSDCCSDYVGGIAGLCAGLIENCTVDGCTISAKTTVPDNPTADGPELTNAVGGIVGGTYKYLEIAAKQRRAPGDEPSPVVGMPNLFHNRVIGNTTISSETNNNTDCPVGAIAGFVTIGTYEKTTLYDNKYAFNVKLYQKNGTKAVTSQKYTQRGTIEYDGYYDTEKHEFIEIYSDLKDVTENEGAMMDTHLVTLTTNPLAGYDMAQAGLIHSPAPATDWTVGTNCYQKDESGHPYIAAEDQVNLNVASTITRENDGRTYYADLALALNGKVLSGTSFTMPAEDANVTATYTEANWFTIDTNQKAWMSFYHEWMTGGDAAASVAANYTVSDPDQKKTIELLTISDVNSKTGTYNTADLNGISYSGVPTLLHAKDGVLPEKLKFVPVADKTAPRYADEYFKGVTEKTDFRTGVYILNAVGDFIYAEPSENDHTLAAHRCYIDLNGNPTAGAPLRLGENDATAVEDLSIVNSQLSTFNSDEWYTLSGVKLEGEPTVKGIYVYNGKKVVIK